MVIAFDYYCYLVVSCSSLAEIILFDGNLDLLVELLSFIMLASPLGNLNCGQEYTEFSWYLLWK